MVTTAHNENDVAVKQAESAVTRSAGALALIGLVGAFGLWLFNSTVIANDATLQERSTRFLRSRNAVVGFRAYTEHDSLFFQALAFSALRDRLSLDQNVSPINWAYSGSLGLPLWQDLACFGDKAEALELERSKNARQIPPAEQSPAVYKARVERYRQIVNQCFRTAIFDDYDPRRAREILNEWSFLSDSAHALEPDAWPTVAAWLATDDWPFAFRNFHPGSFRRDADPINRLRVGNESSHLQERWLQMRLDDTGGNKELVQSLLAQAEQEAFAALKEARSQVIPLLSVPGAPSSMRADDLLMVLGPLLAIVYFLFLVAWIRLENSKASVQPVDQGEVTAKGFPTYNAPNDPLAAGKSGDVGIINIGCRLIWLAFLMAPILLGASMFAVQGKLWLLLPQSDQWSLEAWSWVERIQHSRTLGWPSLALDTVNLASLWLTVICLLEITASWEAHRPGRSAGDRIIVFGLVIAICVLAGQVGYALYKSGTIGFSNAYEIGHLWSYGLYCTFGFLWCWYLGQGLSRGSRTATFVAIGGLCSTAVMFR